VLQTHKPCPLGDERLFMFLKVWILNNSFIGNLILRWEFKII
jgi:hypothetical protein